MHRFGPKIFYVNSKSLGCVYYRILLHDFRFKRREFLNYLTVSPYALVVSIIDR